MEGLTARVAGAPDAWGALAADARHAWHPYTQHRTMPAPLEAVSARGAFIRTRDDREIFDAVSSWWVTLHGHAEPAIARAVARQAAELDQVIFTAFTHEPAALLAAELVRVLPAGLTRVFFSDDGSTAVEVALKMALQHHANRGEPRGVIAALEHAYHGDTFGAMSVSGRGIFTAPFADLLFDVVRLPDPSEDGQATLAALDRLVHERGPALAAVIVEPLLMGAGGMRMYSEPTLRGIAERAHAAGALVIADEVLTGFGRTGPLFASERAGISPDVVCMSKGLTGGVLPLGATAASEAVFESFLSEDPRRTLFHGHSFTANPIACAAARASLALLDAGSAERRAAIEAAHRAGLARLASLPPVAAPRVLGTVAAFDLRGHDGVRGYLSGAGSALARYALARDVLLRPLGDVVYLIPPYCATPADIARVYDVIAGFLEDGGGTVRA